MSDHTTNGLTENDIEELEMESRGGQVRINAVYWALALMLVSVVLFIFVPEMPSTWFPSPRVQSGLAVFSAALGVVGVFLGAWGTNWELFGFNRRRRS